MTQDPEDRDLTPEEDARVRALLAELGGAPMPSEVAARLDDTLAGLVAERELPQEEAEVVPLRARWLPVAAAAAAVLVVLGGVGVAIGALRGADQATSSSTAASGSGGSTADESDPETPQSSGPTAGSAGGVPGAAPSLPALSSTTFTRDATRVVGTHGSLAQDDTSSKAQLRSPAPTCAGPALTAGERSVPVQLDRKPAVLVVHPAQGGTRLVEAWACSGQTRLASARVAP